MLVNCVMFVVAGGNGGGRAVSSLGRGGGNCICGNCAWLGAKFMPCAADRCFIVS